MNNRKNSPSDMDKVVAQSLQKTVPVDPNRGAWKEGSFDPNASNPGGYNPNSLDPNNPHPGGYHPAAPDHVNTISDNFATQPVDSGLPDTSLLSPAALEGSLDGGLHSGNNPKPTKSYAFFWMGGVTAIFLGIIIGVGAGGPVLGQEWNFLWVGVGAALTVAGVGALAEMWPKKRHLRSSIKFGFTGVLLLLTVSFLAGVATTDMVGGSPIWSGSQEAHVHAFTGKTLERLHRLAEIDQYFELNSVDGRLKITDLEDAFREAEGWALEYGEIRSEDLPAPELGEVELMMESTTYQILAAIDARVRWLQTGDPVALRTSEGHRLSMQQGVLNAGRLLRDAAAVYGIIVGDAEGGLVE